ncbi:MULTISPECIES: DUF29 domain-containing protein [unclassified Synechococcus]|uniref:DUF29 domain-containing protein n=1 Tax=unclassified Synechococcus TaxID=2626047 RepID=UPI00006906EF|nr:MULTISPECIES: DUF29 domain-containing protein [unclassified Synechococcus]EAQ70530.1 hypothetical protein RS9917_06825 [Synechococcus sp. RS9917]
MTASLHARDFYGWVQQQCVALREHNSAQLDWDGLQEELEALGRQEYRALVSRLAQNPSLRAKADDAVSDGFEAGVDLVLRETDLSLRVLPDSSAWNLDQALDPSLLCDTRGDWNDLNS